MREWENKIRAARNAGASISQLLLKLESDGHMASVGGQRPVVTLLPEMIAYVTAQFTLEAAEEDRLVRVLVNILPPEEERTVNGICTGIRKTAQDFRNDPDALPGTYEVLQRFDEMAQEYDGAFYSKMHVENPGRLAEYYQQLLDAVYGIAKEVCGKAGADWAF